MRVLQVYKDYFPVVGGIERHIQLLAEGLGARGIEVHVLVTNTGPQTVEECIHDVPVTKSGRLGSISTAPISLSFYRDLVRLSAEADITHLYLPYPPAEIGQLFLRRHKPFVITYHSDIVRQKVLGFFYQPILWQVLRRAERIVVSNPNIIQSSRFLRPFAAKCTVIPLGIDPRRYAATPELSERARAFRASFGGGPLILAVGKFRHYKGFDVLIRALARLPEAEAVIVGTGPLGNEWRALARELGMADRVHFPGEVAEEDLIALYHAADVFALPSTNRAETYGIVQVEAMACGLPVVSTELGTGTSYANQHEVTGLVVAPNDVAALAAALRRLLADQALRDRLGQAGRKRVQGELSMDAMIDQTLLFYWQVLAGRR